MERPSRQHEHPPSPWGAVSSHDWRDIPELADLQPALAHEIYRRAQRRARRAPRVWTVALLGVTAYFALAWITLRVMDFGRWLPGMLLLLLTFALPIAIDLLQTPILR